MDRPSYKRKTSNLLLFSHFMPWHLLHSTIMSSTNPLSQCPLWKGSVPISSISPKPAWPCTFPLLQPDLHCAPLTSSVLLNTPSVLFCLPRLHPGSLTDDWDHLIWSCIQTQSQKIIVAHPQMLNTHTFSPVECRHHCLSGLDNRFLRLIYYSFWEDYCCLRIYGSFVTSLGRIGCFVICPAKHVDVENTAQTACIQPSAVMQTSAPWQILF